MYKSGAAFGVEILNSATTLGIWYELVTNTSNGKQVERF
jgi:hypothetical protein